MGFDGEIDDGWGVVGKVLLQCLRVDGGSHGDGSTARMYLGDGGGLSEGTWAGAGACSFRPRAHAGAG